MARKLGLEIENLHAPFDHPDDLWCDGLNGDDFLDALIACVNDCKAHDIPTTVIHVTDFSEPPEFSMLGLDRIKKLVETAENKEVNLALENTRSLEHLDFVFEKIESARLGFCYDSGHENCYHPDADCLSRYGDKLFAIHLDDNLGDDDTHLLPYDGTVNWSSITEKLKACKPVGYLTLEVDFNPNHDNSAIYKDLSASEYMKSAYERAVKIGRQVGT